MCFIKVEIIKKKKTRITYTHFSGRLLPNNSDKTLQGKFVNEEDVHLMAAHSSLH